MLANRSEALGIFRMFFKQLKNINLKKAMKDHKLVLMGKESADIFYNPTEELFYCTKKEGQCGANLAVRRYWHLAEMGKNIKNFSKNKF